ncbi:MAG: isochorismate synthase [Propionicimonas sp.]|nr:isochorismate synthase [Propionicimonas sp.]MEA5117562.1 isochorismate synthase [Propionicimonas sp.]
MREFPPQPPWRAQTIAIDDPGPLEAYLPAAASLAWLRRGDGMIGLGEAARLEGAGWDEADGWWREFCHGLDIESDLPGVGGPMVFASFPFDPGHTAARSVMVVPQVVLGRRRGQAWLTTIGSEPIAAPVPVGDVIERPRVSGVTGRSLDREQWQHIVAEAVVRIERNELSKVVLARGVDIATAAPIDPRWLVGALADRYPNCWTYCVDGLVGASPEMLVRLEDGLAMSRVLAGTIRRTGAEELDLKLAHALARSSKNLIEHELAVDSVAAALAPFCSGMNVPDAPYVLELPNVLHLASDVTAVAHGDISALHLASELHPSAAVCGTPTVTARATIAELEQLDRGRYSGPVGWMDARGDGEFAIALRCGLIDAADPRSITLYAGCGIVAGSDPAEEYAETEAKLVPMLEALGVPS